jgi:Heparinase II/III-like protein/Heparinase II/III N-terminus
MLQKLNRLREMSGAEIGHRLRERWRQQADRVRCYCRVDHADSEMGDLIRRHHSSLKQYMREVAARRFYPSILDAGQAQQFLATRFPERLADTIGKAMRLVEHRLDILGYTDIELGQEIDWHRDPVSGYQWPQRYWADYDLVHAASADAKVIHELNRHQHLPRLAKAFFLTNDEVYAREAVRQMESWIRQNPQWTGVNWQSSLELAIRSISWMWTIFLLLPSESLDEAALRGILECLFAQLDHVYRYPSVYTSPNTHLIGEATALFMAGIVFEDLPRARAWRDFGKATLTNEMQRQVSAEGVYGEASSYYHCYAADFYLQAMVLARSNRFAFPEWMWKRLEHMLDFVMHITRPDGSLPLIGDDDGGRVLGLSLEDYSSFRDGISSGAVLFGRGDFKHQAGSFYEESFWLLGANAWSVFDAVQAQTPLELGRSYVDSGCFIQRSGWDAQDTQVIFDCGSLGTRTVGHGHADALSFTLFTGGRDILIDPATAVYNAAPKWRNFFRSTSSHNTVVVDNQSQSRPGGPFSWKRKANARVRQTICLPDIEFIDGEHDGYTNLRHEITHRRRMIYVRPNYWIVLDELRGQGEHDFDFLYHFAPNTELLMFGEERKGELDCQARTGDAALQLFMYGSEPIRAEVACGQTSPIQGWASHRYGERHPNPVLRASMRTAAPVSMMTFLMAGKQITQSRRFNGNSKHALAAVIRDGEHDDIAVTCADDGDLHLMDCVMRGEFFWLRMENGNLQRLLAVNAHSFSHAGEKVFDSQTPIPYVQAFFWEDGMVIERGEDEGKVYVRDLRDRQFQRN